MFAIPRTIFARSTDYGRPMKPFFIKIPNFWAWADNFRQIKFGTYGVLSVDLSAPILVLWVGVPCHRVSVVRGQALNHECVANYYPSFYPTPAQNYTMMNFDIILSGFDGFLIMNSSSNPDLFYNNSRRVLNNTNLHCHQMRLHKNASLCTRPTQRYRRSFRVALHISFTQHCATVKWAVLYRKYFLQVWNHIIYV